VLFKHILLYFSYLLHGCLLHDYTTKYKFMKRTIELKSYLMHKKS